MGKKETRARTGKKKKRKIGIESEMAERKPS